MVLNTKKIRLLVIRNIGIQNTALSETIAVSCYILLSETFCNRVAIIREAECLSFLAFFEQKWDQ